MRCPNPSGSWSCKERRLHAQCDLRELPSSGHTLPANKRPPLGVSKCLSSPVTLKATRCALLALQVLAGLLRKEPVSSASRPAPRSIRVSRSSSCQGAGGQLGIRDVQNKRARVSSTYKLFLFRRGRVVVAPSLAVLRLVPKMLGRSALVALLACITVPLLLILLAPSDNVFVEVRCLDA